MHLLCFLCLLCGWIFPSALFILEVTSISKDLRINEEIRVKEIRLVDEQGGQLGIMSPKEAIDIATEKGLDVVEVAPTGRPPVCRIMDYGKYKYEQSKKEREARKNQKIINIKEVKLRPNIEDHDFMTKTKNAIRFLKDGDKVKVTIMFRGREITHPELGKQLCLRLADHVKDIAKVEKVPKVEGRNMTMVLTPISEQQ
ncbi:bacterial translation initiation factor 3 (bIF-3) [Desulfonispora thiosulfatigenes DSM 11270]|uniref:Translation initiation factor IF-3 n=1 Tax=Desulfonispora thiosulfatigenes DSM 11270 TaxID=656914 RepID=A0A1W1VSY4_DESTI|nr:bacterial translation initiation factor 3 (bIF-3) [Desulfonispora thiosulfatigenes DSM 11270]